MTIGTTVSELAPGDVLPTLDYEVTPFAAQLYRQRTGWPAPNQALDREPPVPPTFLHVLKVVLLEHACPDGAGPESRMHYEFDVETFAPIQVGAILRASGTVTEVFIKRERRFMVLQIDVSDARTGVLVARCRDTSLLGSAETQAQGSR